MMSDFPYWFVAILLAILAFGLTSTESMKNRAFFGKDGLQQLVKKAQQAGAARGRADAIVGAKLSLEERRCPENIYTRN